MVNLLVGSGQGGSNANAVPIWSPIKTCKKKKKKIESKRVLHAWFDENIVKILN